MSNKAKGLKGIEEWFLQADYDFETAEVLFNAGRYIYCVFMCHLSVEKMLKGLWEKKFQKMPKMPPKTHDLIYLIRKMKIEFPQELYDFVNYLSNLSVPTRYSESLQKMLSKFNKNHTEFILKNTEEVRKWVKKSVQK